MASPGEGKGLGRATGKIVHLVRLRPSFHILTLHISLIEPILLLARLLPYFNSKSTSSRD